MTTDNIPPIDDLLADLDIQVDKLIYITLVNGLELIGEKIDEVDSPVLTLKNPIKILKATFHDEVVREDYNYLVPFSTFCDGPFITINKNTISITAIPSVQIQDLYCMTLYDHYHPDKAVNIGNLISDSPSSQKNNIIDFLPHLLNKYNI